MPVSLMYIFLTRTIELFETIGKKYIEAQTKEFGTDHLYSADTFNENVPPTNDSTYLDGMSKKVFLPWPLPILKLFG
jgi:hypothetical protein